MAASGPTCDHAVGSVHRTGARSWSPVQYMFPVDAMTPRSPAFHPAFGPVSPNEVTLTQTVWAAVPGSTVRAPGHRGVARTMSAPARSSARTGSSVEPISTTVFPAFHTVNRNDVPSGPKGPTFRSGSPPGGSTLVTSAPRSARIRPVMAAGSPARSTTRTPARRVSGTTSGGGLLEDVDGAGRSEPDDVGQ